MRGVAGLAQLGAQVRAAGHAPPVVLHQVVRHRCLRRAGPHTEQTGSLLVLYLSDFFSFFLLTQMLCMPRWGISKDTKKVGH